MYVAKVKGLAQLFYPCTDVFLTFETEAEQRDVLEKMSVGIVQAEKNIKTAVADPKYLFRGQHVLYVSEPEEPSTIRWQNLNVSQLQRIKSVFITGAVTFLGMIVVFIAVSAGKKTEADFAQFEMIICRSDLMLLHQPFYIAADRVSLVAGAYTITAFNTAFPLLAKALTNSEPHPSESAVQTSLYFKIGTCLRSQVNHQRVFILCI